MIGSSRREFLADVGSGMLIDGGVGVAGNLGISPSFATADFARSVGQMQDTASDELQPKLIKNVRAGDVSPKQLVATGTLANAEAFGGQDYVGLPMAVALLSALSKQLPIDRQTLPVLKVRYRNSGQVQALRGAKARTLAPIGLPSLPADDNAGQHVRDTVRQGKMGEAEQTFASAKAIATLEILHILQYSVQGDINVPRFVLAHCAHRLVGFGRLQTRPHLDAATVCASCTESARKKSGQVADSYGAAKVSRPVQAGRLQTQGHVNQETGIEIT